jgi:CheY-like chemotaxis protein
VRDAEPVVRRLLGAGRRLVVVADAAPQVWVDPEQLQQVVINLALNARDAMPVGGTLTITTAETELPGDTAAAGGVAIPAGRYAALLVRDTGAGMDAAVQAKIFEPFFTTKPIGQGTGLGLAAAHGVLTQNNGYITIASAPGQGAIFTVYLPVLPAPNMVERRGEPPRVGADATQAGATVLVVDDERGVRAIAARILERGGFRVLQAPEGAAALELVDRHGPPQLVLTDLMMPGIGGAELARRLKERWPTLPIIFMSGHSTEELQRQGAIGSEGDLIQKPFTPDALVASVAEALSRVDGRRPAIE